MKTEAIRKLTLRLATAGPLCIVCLLTKLQAATIDFQDGTDGGTVGNFYLSQGVAFSNARWAFLGNFPNVGLDSISGGLQPTPATAIIATFTTPISFVSIDGIDAGKNGIRIDAYDAPTGGSLVGFQQAFGVGNGGLAPLTVSVSAPSIWRIAFYQPRNIGGDNVGFDTLIFTPVPELPSMVLLCAGLTALGVSRLWRRVG